MVDHLQPPTPGNGPNIRQMQLFPGINKSTFADVIKELWPNQAGGGDSYKGWPGKDEVSLDLVDYWIDAAAASEGLIASYWSKPS